VKWPYLERGEAGVVTSLAALAHRIWLNVLHKGKIMTTRIGNVTFGAIKNIRKSGEEEGVYFADVELSEAEGFPFELCLYCARSDDYAMTGRWVYQQIIDGNFEGSITQLDSGVDPVTGLPFTLAGQPTSQGAQTL
jgi:hypothetical protein